MGRQIHESYAYAGNDTIKIECPAQELRKGGTNKNGKEVWK